MDLDLAQLKSEENSQRSLVLWKKKYGTLTAGNLGAE